MTDVATMAEQLEQGAGHYVEAKVPDVQPIHKDREYSELADRLRKIAEEREQTDRRISELQRRLNHVEDVDAEADKMASGELVVDFSQRSETPSSIRGEIADLRQHRKTLDAAEQRINQQLRTVRARVGDERVEQHIGELSASHELIRTKAQELLGAMELERKIRSAMAEGEATIAPALAKAGIEQHIVGVPKVRQPIEELAERAGKADHRMKM